MKSRDDDSASEEVESSTTKVGLGSRWRTGSSGQSFNEPSVEFEGVTLGSSTETACMSEDMSVSGIDNRRMASLAWCCHCHIIVNAGTPWFVTEQVSCQSLKNRQVLDQWFLRRANESVED